MDKLFIALGSNSFINVTTIAFIKARPDGALVVTTTVSHSDGRPYKFIIPAEHSDELRGQLTHWVAPWTSEIQALEEP